MHAAFRRRTFTLLALFTVVALSGAATAKPVVAVEQIAITVSDADRAARFYREVLGFELISDRASAAPSLARLTGIPGARARQLELRLGQERLALVEFLGGGGRPIPPDRRSHDGGFQHVAIVVSDMDAAYRRLREHRVRHVSSAPQTLPASNRAAGGIRAFYFSDPDGHTLELIWFPPGKGDPRWQRAFAPLFQGIDHTAIGVADSDASLHLYRDQLGLRVAGGSVNVGPEQEHLTAVFGAHVRITTLRAARGPGIELLHYLAPRDGRPAPADLRANDLLHWHTTLRVERADGALRAALVGGARTVSPGVVPLADVPLAGKEGALVRDRDGHALLLLR